MVKKYVLTGGPCCGKTSLLLRLYEKGYHIIPEVARDIIAWELKKADKQKDYIPILPKTHLKEFEELVIAEQLQRETNFVYRSTVFLDRSLVDPVAFANHGNMVLERNAFELIKAAGYTQVFLLDRLPYKKDKERHETEKEAEQIHNALIKTYHNLGFFVTSVPVFDGRTVEESIDKRVEHILKRLGDK